MMNFAEEAEWINTLHGHDKKEALYELQRAIKPLLDEAYMAYKDAVDLAKFEHEQTKWIHTNRMRDKAKLLIPNSDLDT